MIVAQLDPAIAITVAKRTPLLYACGDDALEDRPRHVRAASAICRFGDRLIVIQDDANWIASIDNEGYVHPIALPRGEGGNRLFGDDRENKHYKLDLEACTVIEVGGQQVLVAFGSGSTSAREHVVLLGDTGPRVVAAHPLYAALRACAAFSGSELNIEGATVARDRLLFFNRGNGASSEAAKAVNATCSVDVRALVQYLDDGPLPEIESIQVYDLGAVDGTPLTFTDATAVDGRVVYVAAAEASPDAVQDGPVSGVAIGVLGDSPRYGLVRDEGGDPLSAKIEGIVHDRGKWLAVVDVDDTERPAELLELQIVGL